MSFVGVQRTWTAERPYGAEAWLLHQKVAGADGAAALFGIARRSDGALRLALALPRDERPGAARMVLRDPEIAPSRLDPEMLRIVGVATDNPLAAATAPDVVARVVWAADRTDHDADTAFAQDFDSPVTMLWFPEELIADLAALDPREAAAIDVDRAGAASNRLYVEVGDFAAAAVLARILDQASPAVSSE
jgi:hypothetical protein